MSRIPVRASAPSHSTKQDAPTTSRAPAPRVAAEPKGIPNSQSQLSKSTSYASRPQKAQQYTQSAAVQRLSQSVRDVSLNPRAVSQPTQPVPVAHTPIRPASTKPVAGPSGSTSVSKGSLALREHIARARAELTKSTQRTAPRSRAPLPNTWTPVTHSSAEDPYSTVKDPFNQTKGQSAAIPGLKAAIARAKGSGHLNIAFKELSAIPRAVYDMYKPDPNHVIDFSNMDGPAFYEAVELQSLNAADNAIVLLESDLADTFEALQTLDLHNNLLQSLPSNLCLLTQLTTLNLAGNKFETAVWDVILPLAHLMVLNLSNNVLQGDLPNLARLTSLQDLNLSNNKLEDIGDALVSCDNLRTLNLHANRLGHFTVDQLPQPALHLRQLDLSNNKLTSAFLTHDATFLSLESLNLQWNQCPAFATAGCWLTAPKLQDSMLRDSTRA